jgi:hypothetical protein
MVEIKIIYSCLDVLLMILPSAERIIIRKYNTCVRLKSMWIGSTTKEPDPLNILTISSEIT